MRPQNDDVYSFITRDFNRGWGKENGTIPFYRRFFDSINRIQNLREVVHIQSSRIV